MLLEKLNFLCAVRTFVSLLSKPALRFSSNDTLKGQLHCKEEGKFLSLFSSENLEALTIVSSNFHVYENFVNEAEEENFISEIDPVIRRRRYEYDHWDGAIQGYKETEKSDWNNKNCDTLQRLRELAFSPKSPQIASVHVLDLSKTGHIKPHIDSVRFCGGTIAGISLLSSCVMRLRNENQIEMVVDILLPRRSLYIMKGAARYEFTHEVLEEKLSYFKDELVPRDRRVSIICREKPHSEQKS